MTREEALARLRAASKAYDDARHDFVGVQCATVEFYDSISKFGNGYYSKLRMRPLIEEGYGRKYESKLRARFERLEKAHAALNDAAEEFLKHDQGGD